jgi:hypothetical protein
VSKYDPDLIDGREFPPLVVRADTTISGTRNGTIQLESGTLRLRGTNRGTITVHQGAQLLIEGTQAGTAHVASGRLVRVLGAVQGETSVDTGASIHVEPSERLAGGLTNNGLVVVDGIYGGHRRGRGEFRVMPTGRIKEPDIVDGVAMYVWRDRE